MATRGVALTVTVMAINSSTGAEVTGDGPNITPRILKDGTSSSLTTATVTEADATNFPGAYTVSVSSTETDCNILWVGGKSSTANVKIIPTKVEMERLPNAAPGASGGLPTVDASNGVKISVGTGTGQINLASGKAPATLGSGDITGYPDVNTVQLAGQTVTAAAGVTFPTSVASPTNITAGTITTATNVTNAVTVGGYSASQDPATYCLATPSQKLVTDASGRVTIAQTFPANFASLSISGAGKVASTLSSSDVTGNLPAAVNSMANDVITAAAIATSAIAEIQSGLSTLDAAAIRTAVGLAAANLDTQLANTKTAVDTAVTQTQDLPTMVTGDGTVGAKFTTTALSNAPGGGGGALSTEQEYMICLIAGALGILQSSRTFTNSSTVTQTHYVPNIDLTDSGDRIVNTIVKSGDSQTGTTVIS